MQQSAKPYFTINNHKTLTHKPVRQELVDSRQSETGDRARSLVRLDDGQERAEVEVGVERPQIGHLGDDGPQPLQMGAQLADFRVWSGAHAPPQRRRHDEHLRGDDERPATRAHRAAEGRDQLASSPARLLTGVTRAGRNATYDGSVSSRTRVLFPLILYIFSE